jgi:hypothetical protein
MLVGTKSGRFFTVTVPGFRIRIRTDPDQGGQKKPQKYKKVKIFNALKSWMFSFEGLRILL